MYYPSFSLSHEQPMFLWFLLSQTNDKEESQRETPIVERKEPCILLSYSPDSTVSQKDEEKSIVGSDAKTIFEEQKEIAGEDRRKQNREDEEEFIPNMPETGKRRRSCQNENRNVIPNIVHKLFSYMLKNIKSGKLVKQIMEKLLSESPLPQLEKCSVQRYYLYLKPIKNKVNNYVNEDSLLILNQFQDPTFTVYSQFQQTLYIKICRILALHFLTYSYDLTILTSKRMKPEKKQAHLEAKRRLVNNLNNIFLPTLLHQEK